MATSTLNIVIGPPLLTTILTEPFTRSGYSHSVDNWYDDINNWHRSTHLNENTTSLAQRLIQIKLTGVTLTVKNAVSSPPTVAFYLSSVSSNRVSTATYSNKVFTFPNWTSPSGTVLFNSSGGNFNFGVGHSAGMTLQSSNIASTGGSVTFTFTLDDNDILGFAGQKICYNLTDYTVYYPIVAWLMKNLRFTAQNMHEATGHLIKGASSGADIQLKNYGGTSSTSPTIIKVSAITGNTITIANIYNLIKNKTLYAVPDFGTAGTYG